jgi:hypothetical protein
MKNLLLSLIIALCTQNSSAQNSEDTSKNFSAKEYANSVKLSIGDFHIPEVVRSTSLFSIHQMGIFYERKIFKRTYAGVGFAWWQVFDRLFYSRSFGSFAENYIYQSKPIVGALASRLAYKMIDVYGVYKIPVKIKNTNHRVSVGIGTSYTWGENAYISWYHINPEPIHDIQVTYDFKKEQYFGIIPLINYDVLLFNDRINAGLNFKARYYSDIEKPQYDYGVHIGFNF